MRQVIRAEQDRPGAEAGWSQASTQGLFSLCTPCAVGENNMTYDLCENNIQQALSKPPCKAGGDRSLDRMFQTNGNGGR